MTAQDKVREIGESLGEMAKTQPVRMKQHCYTLLRDSVLWSDLRIDSMDNESLIGFITLAAVTVQSNVPVLTDIRKDLLRLGFNTAPLN
jgi:hypothetical protein